MTNSRPRIVVIEDNPVTRKMVVVTLETGGFDAFDAPNGQTGLELIRTVHPDLVIQDFVLPDMNGDELFRQIRATEGGAAIPVVLLSGLTAKARSVDIGFAAVLVKPIAPSRLLENIHAILHAPIAAADDDTSRRYVMVVDDSAANRKLTAFRLELAGFEVAATDSVEAAMQLMRQRVPDAILGDVLMPGLDGFQLCLAVRRDPKLTAVPIVLVSAAYREFADRVLALEAGASELIARTPDLADAISALRAAIRDGARPLANAGRAFSSQYVEGLRRQVSRQLQSSQELAERSAIQASALSLLAAMAQMLSQPNDLMKVLGDVLVHCLDASGLSTGVLYTLDANDQLQLHTETGLSAASRRSAENAFGLIDLLTSQADEPKAYHSDSASAQGLELLRQLDHSAALVVPFILLGRHYGTLVLASDRFPLNTEAWLSFARALATQFAQVIALGHSMSQLSDSATRIQTLMDHANDAISVITPDGMLRDVNLRVLSLLDRTREEVIGHHIFEFAQYTDSTNDDTFHHVVQSGRGAMRGVRLIRRDGSIVLVDFSLSAIKVGTEELILSIGRDMTEQRRLEQQFMQSQKMEAVGRLAGGVAHDFNNILTAIMGNSELLKDEIPAGSPLQDRLNEVMKAGERASALTRQLLAFSRQQIVQPRVINPNVVIGELEKMLGRLIGEDVTMRTHLAATSNVLMDAGQFEQVLLNLAINARDAMANGGTLTIETATVTFPNDAPPSPIGNTAPGAYVRLRVKDTGCGIDPELRDQIFEPFFTTKPVGKGTGLGLSTVFGIVEQSRGAISLVSAVGEGTAFDVYFPVAAAAAAPAVAATPVPAAGGRETVLIAEDDAMLRTLATTVLRKAGYRVLVAADPVDAEAVADASSDDINLLITDVIMPGGNGRDLAAHLAERRPALKVLYTSGYTADIIGQHGVLDAGTAFLPKPFTPSQLRARVREVLEVA